MYFFGNATEKSNGIDIYMTTCIEPYMKILEDGLNASLVGKESYLKGEYIEIDKTKISHKDVLDNVTGIDKLVSSGFSRNEINELLGLPRIDDDWADKHYITKNYGYAEGGETIENNE